MGRGASLAVILGILLLAASMSSCTTATNNDNPATATAQAERSIQLATQMANKLQTTNEVRYAYVTATAEAFQTMLDATRLWPVAYEDTFDEERGDWPVGVEEGELAKIEWRISDGKYQWKADANSGFVWWTLPEADSVGNFYLAADVQQIDGPPDGEAGLVFRSDGDRSYYNFAINNEGNYSLYFHSPEGWEALIDWMPSNHVISSETNRLTVIAQGDRLLLFINDHFLVEWNDTRLHAGEAGLIIGLSYAGEQGTWEFDNFELRAPKGDEIEAARLDTEP